MADYEEESEMEGDNWRTLMSRHMMHSLSINKKLKEIDDTIKNDVYDESIFLKQTSTEWKKYRDDHKYLVKIVPEESKSSSMYFTEDLYSMMKNSIENTRRRIVENTDNLSWKLNENDGEDSPPAINKQAKRVHFSEINEKIKEIDTNEASDSQIEFKFVRPIYSVYDRMRRNANLKGDMEGLFENEHRYDLENHIEFITCFPERFGNREGFHRSEMKKEGEDLVAVKFTAEEPLNMKNFKSSFFIGDSPPTIQSCEHNVHTKVAQLCSDIVSRETFVSHPNTITSEAQTNIDTHRIPSTPFQLSNAAWLNRVEDVKKLNLETQNPDRCNQKKAAASDVDKLTLLSINRRSKHKILMERARTAHQKTLDILRFGSENPGQEIIASTEQRPVFPPPNAPTYAQVCQSTPILTSNDKPVSFIRNSISGIFSTTPRSSKVDALPAELENHVATSPQLSKLRENANLQNLLSSSEAAPVASQPLDLVINIDDEDSTNLPNSSLSTPSSDTSVPAGTARMGTPTDHEWEEIRRLLTATVQTINEPLHEQNRRMADLIQMQLNQTARLEELSNSRHDTHLMNAEASAQLLRAMERKEVHGDRPKLEITKFEGDKSYYQIFKKMFEDTFGHSNESIKYRHLRNLVVGKAAKHISFIDSGPGGYELMWRVLDKEYFPKRSACVESLCEASKVPRPKINDVESLRDFYITVKRIYFTVKRTQRGNEALQLLHAAVKERLDQASANVYADQVAYINPDETMENFIDFLKNRIESLETKQQLISNLKS